METLFAEVVALLFTERVQGLRNRVAALCLLPCAPLCASAALSGGASCEAAQTVSSPTSCQTSSSLIGTAQATSFQSYGVLKASASADARIYNNNYLAPTVARATSTFDDQLKFNVPGHNQGAAIVTFEMIVNGDAGIVVAGQGNSETASWSLNFTAFADVTNSSTRGESVKLDSMGTPVYTFGATNNQLAVPLGSPVELTVRFNLADPFILHASLTADAYAYHGGDAFGDAAHSAYYAGISSFSLDGVSVPFSITSQTGTDWTQSQVSNVPEPASYALMLGGLGFMGVFAARRRTRRL